MFSEPIFNLFGSGVYLYGICMAVGIICCFIFLYIALEHIHANEESINKMLLLGVVATAFGVFMAAVFQGIYDAIAGYGFSLGGLTFYGGLIGGVCGFLVVYLIYVYAIAPRAKRKLLQNHMNMSLTDGLPFVPIGIGIAHAFGRLGCTFAGCCYGVATDAWYGIYIRELGYKCVPTQLYEGIFIAILTVVMFVLYFKFKFKYNISLYCIGYGVFRFIIDFARGDDRGSFVPGLTPSQFWAIVMVVIGIGYLFFQIYFLNKFMKHPELEKESGESARKTATDGDLIAVATGADANSFANSVTGEIVSESRASSSANASNSDTKIVTDSVTEKPSSKCDAKQALKGSSNKSPKDSTGIVSNDSTDSASAVEHADAGATAAESDRGGKINGATWACIVVMVAALILAIVGVCVNFAVGSREIVYKLDSYLLNSSYANSTAAYSFAYISLAVVLVLALGYAVFVGLAVKYKKDSKVFRYVLLALSMAVILISIVMLILSNNMYEGSHINYLDSGTGAKILFLGCVLAGISGMCASLKSKV